MDVLVLLVVLAALGVVVALVFSLVSWLGGRRRKAMDAAARRLGLAYEPESTEWLAQRYGAFQACSEGRNPRALHVLRGQHKGVAVRCFDYEATIKRGKNSSTITRGVVVAVVPSRFTPVRIVPEHLGHRLAEAVGMEDIDFESDEFSRRFWVRSEDRKLAYDLLHPRMMEWLLEVGPSRWEVHGPAVLHWEERKLRPDELEARLDRVTGFVERIPRHVWRAHPSPVAPEADA